MRSFTLAVLAILPLLHGCDHSLIQKESKLVTGNIINGAVIDEANTASTFSVFFINEHGNYCSGSLIASNVILTAAHCLNNVKAEDLRLSTGLQIRTREESQNFLKVKNIFRHPNWSSENDQDDIALLELAEQVDSSFRPVALFDGTLPLDFATFPLEAYGYSVYTTSLSMDLTDYIKDIVNESYPTYVSSHFGIYQLRGKLLPASENWNKASGENYIFVNQLAGGICQGDSGGSMVVTIDGEKVQIGVNDSTLNVKGGTDIDCSSYSFSTFVQPYLSWMNETLAAHNLPAVNVKHFAVAEDISRGDTNTFCVYSQQNVSDILIAAKDNIVSNICDKKLITDLQEYVAYAAEYCITDLSKGYQEALATTVKSVTANCEPVIETP